MYTMQDLEKDIHKIGVSSTDTLTVHTSLKSIGPIDNTQKTGAEVLIDALKNSVSDGILMIPSHTYANIRETPVFNIRKTMPCNGTLPCVAVELANKAYGKGDTTCIRSMQVSHSVVAFGKGAHEFVACDRTTKTRTPIAGCYGNLYRNNGKILLIGVGLNKNTFIHMVDEYLDYDCGKREPDGTTYIHTTDYDGTQWEQERILTYGPGAADFERYTTALQQANAISYGKIGDAAAMLIDAKKCFDIVFAIRKEENM